MLWAEQAQITDLFNKGKLTSHKTGKGQNQESIQVQSNKNRKKKKRGKTRGKRLMNITYRQRQKKAIKTE